MRIDLKNKRNPALVLSGGGIKAAAFHIGVCLALSEKGFHFQGGLNSDPDDLHFLPNLTFRTFVGSSAGSIISAILAAGYSVEDLIKAHQMGIRSKNFNEKKTALKPLTYWDIFSLNSPGFLKAVPVGLRKKWLITGGIEAFLKAGFKLNGMFRANGIEKYFRTNVLKKNSFKDYRSQLFIVASELNNSRKVIFGPVKESSINSRFRYINDCNISDAIAASISLPPVFAPYCIKDKKGNEEYFFDGEIRDTLSTHVAADVGCDLVVASYSTQPYHYNEKMGSLHKYGIPVVLNQALYLVIQQKIEAHINHQENLRSVIAAIEGYFKQASLPEEHRHKMVEIIERNLQFRKNVDYIYIHPDPKDYEFFFIDHFSLSSSILEKTVRIGFKSAIRTLRHYNL